MSDRAPNILFVFCDQLRYSALGSSGNAVARTPHLNRMAAEGLVFDQAFSSCPLCSPYRAQILTGRYSHSNGVLDNEYRLFDSEITLANALRDAGYRTAFAGKWHLGKPPFPEMSRYGFTDFFANRNTQQYFRTIYWENGRGPLRPEGYAPELETEWVLDWIRQGALESPEKPFFAILSFAPPHWNSLGSDNDYGQYPPRFKLPNPDGVDVPANVPRQMRDFARGEIADYHGMVASLDACMGKLLEGLEEMGVADDTIVCFSSDHGDHLSAHGYGKPCDHWLPPAMQASKLTPYEESVHVPFLLRWPAGLPRPRRSQAMLSSVDVMPTLLSLCGRPVPPAVQGTDLSAVVHGDDSAAPDSVYLQILGPGWPKRAQCTGLWRGVRTHRQVYARWYGSGQGWLFDRQTDPREMRNLADHPDHSDLLREMEHRLQDWITHTADPFDTGPRLPQTHMLDLGQYFFDEAWMSRAPAAYAGAIAKNRERFRWDD